MEEDLVKDGWTEIIRNLISMANYRGKDTNWEEVPKLMELADFQKMEQIRSRAETLVDDKETAESLNRGTDNFVRGRVFTTAICRHSTEIASASLILMAKAWRGLRKKAWWPTESSTRSTALFLPQASKSVQATLGELAIT